MQRDLGLRGRLTSTSASATSRRSAAAAKAPVGRPIKRSTSAQLQFEVPTRGATPLRRAGTATKLNERPRMAHSSAAGPVRQTTSLGVSRTPSFGVTQRGGRKGAAVYSPPQLALAKVARCPTERRVPQGASLRTPRLSPRLSSPRIARVDSESDGLTCSYTSGDSLEAYLIGADVVDEEATARECKEDSEQRARMVLFQHFYSAGRAHIFEAERRVRRGFGDMARGVMHDMEEDIRRGIEMAEYQAVLELQLSWEAQRVGQMALWRRPAAEGDVQRHGPSTWQKYQWYCAGAKRVSIAPPCARGASKERPAAGAEEEARLLDALPRVHNLQYEARILAGSYGVTAAVEALSAADYNPRVAEVRLAVADMRVAEAHLRCALQAEARAAWAQLCRCRAVGFHLAPDVDTSTSVQFVLSKSSSLTGRCLGRPQAEKTAFRVPLSQRLKAAEAAAAAEATAEGEEAAR
eukprot:TRINITY_DN7219_c0_g5_i1.p1 TRINITY_DN7219_c0_g5~~TRINITY_DN7219_c0_g5_i1.p1  ORF type:complete len:465 (+),score=95.23 TRINITY_DN7219_c0_g5_i1:54-1448(+)